MQLRIHACLERSDKPLHCTSWRLFTWGSGDSYEIELLLIMQSQPGAYPSYTTSVLEGVILNTPWWGSLVSPLTRSPFPLLTHNWLLGRVHCFIKTLWDIGPKHHCCESPLRELKGERSFLPQTITPTEHLQWLCLQGVDMVVTCGSSSSVLEKAIPTESRLLTFYVFSVSSI